jgi:DNA repair and recombination protein RAD54B
MYKPFRPPLLKAKAKPEEIDLASIPESDDDSEINPRPYKKRRVLVHIVEDSPPSNKAPSSSAVHAPRKPLVVVKKSVEPSLSAKDNLDGLEGYYMVLWCVISGGVGLEVERKLTI